MKVCSGCGENKDNKDFHRDTRSKSGLQSRCKSCRRPGLQKYYQENKKKILEYQKGLNKEHRAEINRRSRKNNLEARLEYSRNYYQNNKDKHREKQRRRRARKRSQVGNVPEGYELILWRDQGGKCFYCHTDLREAGFHEDHKTPLSRGGFHTKKNLCLSCPSCNLRKHTKTDVEFLRVLSNE